MLIANDGADPVTGTFSNWPHQSIQTVNGQSFRLLTNGGDGNDVTLKAATSGGVILLIK